MEKCLKTELIELAGGEVIDNIITNPVILPLCLDNNITLKCKKILDYYVDSRGLQDNASYSDKLIDFANRLTYFSFNSKKTTGEFLSMLKKLKHTGFFKYKPYVFLIAGVSMECILELVSSKSNVTCRTTSSATKQADTTLYTNTTDNIYLNKFLQLRKDFVYDNKHLSKEYLNQFNLCSKAGYAVVSMTLEEWDKVSKSRIKDNGEKEVTDVFLQIRKYLLLTNNI